MGIEKAQTCIPPALQSEVQDWAIRKTPSATIKATPPTSTDSTRSREPVATA
jgi:hypothetical protein